MYHIHSKNGLTQSTKEKWDRVKKPLVPHPFPFCFCAHNSKQKRLKILPSKNDNSKKIPLNKTECLITLCCIRGDYSKCRLTFTWNLFLQFHCISKSRDVQRNAFVELLNVGRKEELMMSFQPLRTTEKATSSERERERWQGNLMFSIPFYSKGSSGWKNWMDHHGAQICVWIRKLDRGMILKSVYYGKILLLNLCIYMPRKHFNY